MRKLFYSLFIVAIVSATLSSCTEEEVKPKSALESGAGGGGSLDEGKVR